MSNLLGHALTELDRIGFDPEDTAVLLDILTRFFDRFDSGGSVGVAVPILCRLLDVKPLAPLTGEPDEWIDRSDVSSYPIWQNRRCSTVFKDEAHAYDINHPDVTVTFPYSPA